MAWMRRAKQKSSSEVVVIRLTWPQRIAIAAGFNIGYAVELLEGKNRIVAKAGDLVETFGFILGLELASLAIVAALPIESWLRKLRSDNLQTYSEIVQKLKGLPCEYHSYTAVQMCALVPMLVLRFWVPDENTLASRLISGFVVSATMLVLISVWQSLQVMRTLAKHSFDRFDSKP
jgi:predicted lysophospholipase L1 biosynthesis ABC-type transport system permease subunit